MSEMTIKIAVYNTEKFLDVCLNGVISRSVRDIKTLCFDNYGKHNSLAILKRYSKSICNMLADRGGF